MRIRNDITKEYKTILISDDDSKYMKYETRTYKGKQVVMRVWYDGWYPLNPVDGLDIRAKREKVKHRNKVISIRYKG